MLNVLTEDQEQIFLMRWASYHTVCRDYLLHIPNGGSRHILEAKKLKRMGVKKGVPDLMLLVPNKSHHGLFIELKRRKKSKVSNEQVAMMSLIKRQGYCVNVCYGWEEAKKVIEEYLVNI